MLNFSIAVPHRIVNLLIMFLKQFPTLQVYIVGFEHRLTHHIRHSRKSIRCKPVRNKVYECRAIRTKWDFSFINFLAIRHHWD